MNNNCTCGACQHHEDFERGRELLKKVISAALYAQLVKTEDAYVNEKLAVEEFCKFSDEHPDIHEVEHKTNCDNHSHE